MNISFSCLIGILILGIVVSIFLIAIVMKGTYKNVSFEFSFCNCKLSIKATDNTSDMNEEKSTKKIRATGNNSN